MSATKLQKKRSSPLLKWYQAKVFWLKHNYEERKFQHILKGRLSAANDELWRVRDENESVDAPACLVAEEAMHKVRDMVMMGERERLRRKARFWGVYFPSILESDWYENLRPGRTLIVLKPDREHAVRTQIFQKKITLLGWVFGAIFGFSSVIQAGFAVASYYWPRH